MVPCRWLGRGIGGAVVEAVRDLPASFPDRTWLVWLARAVLGSVPLVIAAWVAAGPLQVLSALIDVATTQQVEGLVLRHRPARTNNKGRTVSYWVAVQSGPAERIRAYRVSAKLAGSVQQGAVVRLGVTKVLGWVRALEPLAAVPMSPNSDGQAPVAPAAGATITLQDTASSLQLLHRAEELVRSRDRSPI